MSDHIDGPRQIGDPSADLTDLFTLPSYSCRCVHGYRDLGVRPQAQSAL